MVFLPDQTLPDTKLKRIIFFRSDQKQSFFSQLSNTKALVTCYFSLTVLVVLSPKKFATSTENKNEAKSG